MPLSFQTARLFVSEISDHTPSSELSNLLTLIPKILTPAVVAHLPAYFHGIESTVQARIWLEQMTEQSRLLVVSESNTREAIGFIFAFVDETNDAHIGYLLTESHWGQGLASELLRGFIIQVKCTQNWLKLIGGVDRTNITSTKLLLKLGFVEQLVHSKDANEVVFYEYLLAK